MNRGHKFLCNQPKSGAGLADGRGKEERTGASTSPGLAGHLYRLIINRKKRKRESYSDDEVIATTIGFV